MVSRFIGPFIWGKASINANVDDSIGVYYCCHYNQNQELIALYVGSSEEMKTRLMTHLSQVKWPDVTHFGFSRCSTIAEALIFESSEISRLKPKYNRIGKTSYRF